MIDDRERPSRLGGFWALLVGGAGIASSLAVLDPIMRFEDCPNYGASGNASAFDNPAWDLYFPLLMLGWVVLIAVEQVLPVTWRNRSGADIAVRATSALTLSVSSSCCFVLKVTLVCH
ncbi:hypothetical protein ABZY58_21390 [Micromonospora tulbaghiae]|uniref:hypothetical protein n=1 Tax=Micromonospora tulbaghiae TaxID=479978 RepID=UPI0033B3FEEC